MKSPFPWITIPMLGALAALCLLTRQQDRDTSEIAEDDARFERELVGDDEIVQKFAQSVRQSFQSCEIERQHRAVELAQEKVAASLESCNPIERREAAVLKPYLKIITDRAAIEDEIERQRGFLLEYEYAGGPNAEAHARRVQEIIAALNIKLKATQP